MSCNPPLAGSVFDQTVQFYWMQIFNFVVSVLRELQVLLNLHFNKKNYFMDFEMIKFKYFDIALNIQFKV